MTTSILAQGALTCGCAREKGLMVHRCEESARLWAALQEARDELAGVNGRSKGYREKSDAFVAARDAYHEHIRPEAS